jgi:hypothetical protein
MTIKFQNSISVKIPNTELVVPDPYIASDGAVQTNTSVRNVVINSLQAENVNDLPYLGRLFLSSAYMMVNQEAGKFTIWQANTGSKASDIVAVDKQSNVVSESCVDSTGGSTNTKSLPTSPVTPPATPPATPPVTPPVTPPPQKLSAGAIGGIIGGAVGGIAILGAIGFFLYRRRGTGGAPAEMVQKSELQGTDVKLPTYDRIPSKPHELPVYQYNVSELDSRAVDSNRF